VKFGGSSRVSTNLVWNRLPTTTRSCGWSPTVSFDNGINSNIDAITPLQIAFTSSGSLSGIFKNYNIGSKLTNVTIATQLTIPTSGQAQFIGWNIFGISSSTISFNSYSSLILTQSTFTCRANSYCRFIYSPDITLQSSSMTIKASSYQFNFDGTIRMSSDSALYLDYSSFSGTITSSASGGGGYVEIGATFGNTISAAMIGAMNNRLTIRSLYGSRYNSITSTSKLERVAIEVMGSQTLTMSSYSLYDVVIRDRGASSTLNFDTTQTWSGGSISLGPYSSVNVGYSSRSVQWYTNSPVPLSV
jgi:hypothetical protein